MPALVATEPARTTAPSVVGIGAGEAAQGFLYRYARTDLQESDKKAIAQILKQHGEAMMAILQKKIEAADRIIQLNAEQESFITSLLPYIATDKVGLFKAEMAPRGGLKHPAEQRSPSASGALTPSQPVMMPERHTTTPAVAPKPKNTVLPESVRKAVDKKLATLETTEAKIAWLKNVSAKIDTLKGKVLSNKNKNLLKALQGLINERLDALDTQDDTQEMMNDLLK